MLVEKKMFWQTCNGVTLYQKQNNFRIDSVKFKLRFAKNHKSYYLSLVIIFYVILLYIHVLAAC